jgi:hypothetical protein
MFTWVAFFAIYDISITCIYKKKKKKKKNYLRYVQGKMCLHDSALLSVVCTIFNL